MSDLPPTEMGPGTAGAPVAGSAPPAPGWRAWAAAAAVAAVVAVGGGFALAQTGGDPSAAASGPSAMPGAGMPGGRDGTTGTVTANRDGTLTVKGVDGTATTVEVTADTAVTRTVEGTLEDLEVGDHVLVMGQASGSTTAAERIIDTGDAGDTAMAGPGGPMGAPTAGAITEIAGSTITIETSDGASVAVTASSSTTVTTSEAIAVGDIATGDTVMVQGAVDDTTVTATEVRVGDLPRGGPGGAGGPGAVPGAPGGLPGRSGSEG